MESVLCLLGCLLLVWESGQVRLGAADFFRAFRDFRACFYQCPSVASVVYLYAQRHRERSLRVWRFWPEIFE